MESGEPTERIGHFGDLQGVGIGVGKNCYLADGIGEGDDAELIVIADLDRIALRIDDLGQKNVARGSVRGGWLGENVAGAIRKEEAVAIERRPGEDALAL